MITVKNLTKIYKTPYKYGNFFRHLFSRKFEEKKALDSISFSIGENELVGFIGPNGAGKTTTMKILSGILYPTEGKVEVLGFTPFDKKHPFLKQIGFVMGQKNQLLWELPAVDSFKLNKEIYEIPDDSYKKTLSALVEMLDAKTIIHQPLKTLSLGQRMRMELIASLIHQPKILFLDEPTIGLDIFAQTIIRNFIKEYQQRYKATIILTSHYMQDVQKLAQRVIVINQGKIIYDGKLKDLLSHYSNTKLVQITLDQQMGKSSLLEKIEHEYIFPVLKLKIQKDHLDTILPKILHSVSFTDLTVEDEPIEEVIKRVFARKK
jgi:ABC-2 type transport system ATP-binding protein